MHGGRMWWRVGREQGVRRKSLEIVGGGQKKTFTWGGGDEQDSPSPKLRKKTWKISSSIDRAK